MLSGKNLIELYYSRNCFQVLNWKFYKDLFLLSTYISECVITDVHSITTYQLTVIMNQILLMHAVANQNVIQVKQLHLHQLLASTIQDQHTRPAHLAQNLQVRYFNGGPAHLAQNLQVRYFDGGPAHLAQNLQVRYF